MLLKFHLNNNLENLINHKHSLFNGNKIIVNYVTIDIIPQYGNAKAYYNHLVSNRLPVK